MEVTVLNFKDVKELIDFISSAMEEENKEEVQNDDSLEFNKGLLYLEAISNLAKKKDVSGREVSKWLDDIVKISPSAAFSILLKELALILDSKYGSHISEVDFVYIVSTINGKIHKINKNQIRNYNNFAAFRTVEDAELACRVLKNPLKVMFPSEQEK